MGQITRDFAERAMACCKEGKHPSLTVWETQQLLHAWLAVHIEPTEEMRVAGFECAAWDELGSAVLRARGWPYSCRESSECVAAIYRAMVASALKG